MNWSSPHCYVPPMGKSISVYCRHRSVSPLHPSKWSEYVYSCVKSPSPLHHDISSFSSRSFMVHPASIPDHESYLASSADTRSCRPWTVAGSCSTATGLSFSLHLKQKQRNKILDRKGKEMSKIKDFLYMNKRSRF